MQSIGQVRVAATLESLSSLREQLSALLLTSSLAEPRRADVLLGVSELATNIIRHGQPKATTIAVTLQHEAGVLSLTIEDDGGPFDTYAAHAARSRAKPLAHSVGEHGMGLALVANLFPDQSYETADPIQGVAANRLTLRLGAPGVARPRVAVVDDDDFVRQLLCLYLSDEFDVAGYSDGAQALAALQEHPVDLVISDIRMPAMDGFELRRQLALTARTDLMPFIFLTGDDSDENLDEAAGLGVDDYLVKPVRKPLLSAAVKRVLNRAAQLRQRLGNRLDQQITAALRPALPNHVGGFRVAVRTRSATAGGGDFVHWRRQGDSHFLVLGDIMGHGEQAKFFAHAHTGFFVGLLQGAARDGGPGQWLEALSQAAAHSPLLEATLVTCLALELGPGGQVTVASAGHPAPFLVGPSGVRSVEVGGSLPGLAAQAEYEERRLTLDQGRLFLYTDGVFEGVADAQGRDGLRSAVLGALAECHTLPLESAADALITEFDRVTRNAPTDDATFILLEAVR